MAEQIRKHQMHYDPKVKGVWSGFGIDLNPVRGQREQILVTNVAEAMDCLKCLRIREQSTT